MNILFLQGPMGPFFNQLSNYFKKQGHEVWKINFNGGDQVFSSAAHNIEYKESIESWTYFLRDVLVENNIQLIFGYGDCRIYHQIAKKIAEYLKIPIYFFEEGYFRPNFITLEKSGVNNNSTLPRSPQFYRYLKLNPIKKQINIGSDFSRRIIYSIIYYLATALLTKKYKHYRHHRSISPIYEGLSWLRSGLLKYPYKIKSLLKYKLITKKFGKKFYLFPLQIKDDAQIKFHYPKGSIKKSLETVIRSFSQRAPGSTALIIKHHPMDRGHTNYNKTIKELSKKFGVTDRVFYVDDLPNPVLLRNSQGLVTINSTMGLSGILHRRKVITLGKCFYNIEGLTFQGKLDAFWTTKFRPNAALFESFRNFVISKTQLNQSFYKPLSFDQTMKSLDPDTLVREYEEKTSAVQDPVSMY